MKKIIIVAQLCKVIISKVPLQKIPTYVLIIILIIVLVVLRKTNFLVKVVIKLLFVIQMIYRTKTAQTNSQLQYRKLLMLNELH